MAHSFDTSLVVGFLILTLIIGLGHGQKVKTIKDYALGGRNFSTAALVATIVATWASGSGFFATLSRTYSDGFLPVFASFGIGLSFLILSSVLIPRMGEFLGKTSIAEAMGDLYGQKVRIITAIAGSIGSAGLIAVQFRIFGNIFAYFVNMPSYISIIGAGVIATTYSAFGGIRAVTFTDVLQFFAFGIIIPFIGFFVWNEFYYQGFTVVQAASNPRFNPVSLFNYNNPKLLGMIFMFAYFAIPSISPPAFQRIAIGKDIDQIKKAFFIAGIFLILIQIITAWIPFLIYTMNPFIQEGHLLGYIVDNYSYSGLKGMIVVTIIALAMSTADSRINAVTVLFTNDICKVLSKKLKHEIFISRLFALILGAGSLVLALIETDILDIILLAHSFYYPLITPIFLLTIFGFRTSSKSVLIALIAASVATILWKILPITFVNVSQKLVGIFFSMLVNIIFLFGSHYLLKQEGGWVGIKDRTYIDKQKVKRLEFKKTIVKWLNNFTFNDFLKHIAPKNDFAYTAMGIYFAIYSITTMYSTHFELKGNNGSLIAIFYQIMLITGTTIAMYQIWPLSVSHKIKETIIRIWWPIAAFYMLIFFSCFFVIVSKFNMIQVALFVLNLVIVSMLFGWRAALILIPVGFYLSIKFYQLYFGLDNFYISIGSPEFILIYLLLIVGIALLIFLKPKQEQFEATEEKAEHLEYEVKGLEREVDHARRELENVVQGLEFLENQFQDKEGKLKSKEIYLKDQLKLRNIEISKLKDLKDEFIRNIPHETNTPMTGILSLSEVLYSCYDSLDEKIVKQSIKDIVSSSDRLKSFVSNIADLSKLSALTYELNKTKVDLSELARERPVLYKKIFADDDKQEFTFKVEDKLIVQCDEYYITQAIDSLISNAVKYGEGKPITISLVRTEDNKVQFNISDEGIGIPKDELISIFNKFTVSSKTQTPAGGRGVGLALCEKVITVHGGTIEAQSDGKKGSSFSFVLPIEKTFS